MPSVQSAEAQAVTRALAHATTAASHAPSIHNTQPWRWRAHGDHLELFLGQSRTLAVTDPERPLAILSCGAALHHALVSLAAEGQQATITRLPDKAEPTHLATVRADSRSPVEASAIRHLQTIVLRHTDRRPVQSAAIDAQKLGSIATAAESQSTSLHVLRPRQIFDLASATDDAQPGKMTIADTHHRTAVFAILYGPGEDDLDWLRAGEALSAVWLKATELELSIVPLSATMEVAATRETVRRLLSGRGHPYLVLRFGVLGPAR
jgi:nitroreductase